MKMKYKPLVFFITLGVMMIGCLTLYVGSDSRPTKQTNTELAKEPLETEEENEETDGQKAAEGDSSNPSVSGDSKLEIAGKVLAENKYPEINSLVEKYLTACANADMSALSSCVSNVSHMDRSILTEKYKYIESFENINCYTADSVREGEYQVYVYTEFKISGVDTPAPGLLSLYVAETSDGSYCIYLEPLDSEVQDFVSETDDSDEVKKLVEQVDYRFESACNSDADLLAFTKQMSEHVVSE